MKHNKEPIKISQVKAEIIRNALTGIGYWISDPIPFIYPVVDYLQLLCQENVEIQFVSLKEKDKIIFGERKAHLTISDNTKQLIIIPHFKEGNTPLFGISIQCNDFCPSKGRHSCQRFFKLFNSPKSCKMNTFNQFLKRLHDSLEYYSTNFNISKNGFRKNLYEFQNPKQKTLADPLLPIQQKISSIYSLLQNKLEKRNPFLNIFAHVLTGSNNGKTQFLHLLLSENQERLFRCECEKVALSYDDLFLDIINYFSESISLAFSNLKKGVVSKIKISKPIPSLLQKLLKFSQYEMPNRIIFMPIHVEGAPWMIISRLYKNSDVTAWEDNFFFYHNFLHRLGVHIRTGIKQCFLDVVEQTLFDAIESKQQGEKLINTINLKWKQLSKYYPYSQLQLKLFHHSKLKKREQVLLLEANDYVGVIKLKKNPYFGREFSYDSIDPLLIIKRCYSVVSSHNEALRHGEIKAELSIAHDIDTPISVLQEEYDVLSESGKLAVDYLEIWRRFAKRDFNGQLPKSIDQLFDNSQLFFKSVYALGHYRAKRRNMAPRDTQTKKQIATAVLLENSSSWLDVDIKFPAELFERTSEKWVSFTKTWLLFFAIGAAHHTIAYSFEKCHKPTSFDDNRIRRSLFKINFKKTDEGILLQIINRGDTAEAPPSMFHSSLMDDLVESKKIELTSNSFTRLPSYEVNEEPSIYPTNARLLKDEKNGAALWVAEIQINMSKTTDVLHKPQTLIN